MAAFNTSMIPASITTFEELFWFAYAGLRSVAGRTVIGLPQIDNSVINVDVMSDTTVMDNQGRRYKAIAAYLQVPLDYEVTPGKLHGKVIEMFQASVGSQYITD